MYIKEFVKEALSQITEGLSEVEPEWTSDDQKSPGLGRSHWLANAGSTNITVDFDLAATIEGATKGKAGIHVWFAETGGSMETRNISLSRVKFSVQIEYPSRTGSADSPAR